MTVIYCYDMSAAIPDYSGRPLMLPENTGQPSRPATFSHFAQLALNSAYEGEDLAYEAKAYRSNLCDKIKFNPTAVNLNFVDRMLICELVNRVAKTPLIFQRFVEHLEKNDIPAIMAPVESPPPVEIPPTPAENVEQTPTDTHVAVQ